VLRPNCPAASSPMCRRPATAARRFSPRTLPHNLATELNCRLGSALRAQKNGHLICLWRTFRFFGLLGASNARLIDFQEL